MSRDRSQEQILTEAVTLRAEAYRRWREAAVRATAGRERSLYEALAHLECDRYEALVRRFVSPGAEVRRADLSPAALKAGASRPAPLRAAAVAAEAERRAWATLLRRRGGQAPERHLLTELIEDARRVRDLVKY